MQCYVAEDFSTDSLLLVLAKHEARNACPAEYFANLGFQIKGADKELSELAEPFAKLDETRMQEWGNKREIKFHFGVPHYPEGQGAVCSGAHGGGGQERAEGDHQVKDIHIWPVGRCPG